MAKSSFTSLELSIWNSIYGPSRGPTPGRLKIIVEDFAARGLVPVMMGVWGDMSLYDDDLFQSEIREACKYKEDDRVQVYYHPVDCERVAGSSATTWTHWGRLILQTEGLSPEGAGDDDPAVVENVPRLRLPIEVRDELAKRGVATSSVCRLVSARMVAFYIAAQYEAWATPAQVSQIVPFKNILKRQGFSVRDVIVRKDEGLDSVLDGLFDPVLEELNNQDRGNGSPSLGGSSSDSLFAQQVAGRMKRDGGESVLPDILDPYSAEPGPRMHVINATWRLTPEDVDVLRPSMKDSFHLQADPPYVNVSIPVGDDDEGGPARTRFSLEAVAAAVEGRKRNTHMYVAVGKAESLGASGGIDGGDVDGHDETMPAWKQADVVPADLVEPEPEEPEEIVDDIDAEIANTLAKLRGLRERKQEAFVEQQRLRFLAAAVQHVELDKSGNPLAITLAFQDGAALRIPLHAPLGAASADDDIDQFLSEILVPFDAR